MARDFSNILITGASRGLGAALALGYAEPGIKLALLARDATALSLVAEECRQRGADVTTASIDVTDIAAISLWIHEYDQTSPLDLVIANAGVSSTIRKKESGESWNQIAKVIDTNIYGVLATITPAIECMLCRGHGQVAIMSSLGGYVGMPISPAYNASKAAVKVYGEGLRGLLAPRGIGVTVICPGFVRSGMSASYPGPTPFLVSGERAAAIIKRNLARNRARIAFPLPLAVAMWFLALLPTPLSLGLQKLFKFDS